MKRFWAWLRWSFSWSNTLESWKERLSLLGLLAACIGLWWATGLVPQEQEGWAWTLRGLLAVAVVALLGPAGFRFFGPVLFYEMVRSARRSRYFFLRFAYAGLLLFIFFSIGLDRPSRLRDYRQASLIAMQFFEAFMVVQLLAVSMLTPAYVAGTIAEEKEKKTMEFLLATDLRNREIVLSKLMARLLYLSLFLLTGLPILSLIQFLGGIDPNLVLAGFAATGLTMYFLGGIAILNSVLLKRPRDAIALTYLYGIGYYALSLIGFALLRSPWAGNVLVSWTWNEDTVLITLGDVCRVFGYGNPVVAITQLGMASGGPGGINVVVPTLLANYAWFTLIVGTAAIVTATFRLRLVALQQAYGKTRKARRSLISRPPIGDLPMLWKEVHVEGGARLNLLAAFILLVLVAATLAPGGFMVYYFLTEDRHSWDRAELEFNMYVRTAGTAILFLYWLAVAIRASTAFSGERDRRTLDDLLTAPLEGKTILWGKFWGCLASIRWGWLWPGAVWLLGLATGGMHFLALPLVVGVWFLFGSLFVMIGLYCSMTCKTSMRATVATVLWTFGICGGHWLIWFCCGPILSSVREYRTVETLLRFHAGLTPPVIQWMMPYCGQEFAIYHGRHEFLPLLGFVTLGTLCWAGATFAFWSLTLGPRFLIFANRQEERRPDMLELWQTREKSMQNEEGRMQDDGKTNHG